MLNGGAGIAHLNMNNSDNRVNNLKWVKEGEARKMLMDFEEISVDQAIKTQERCQLLYHKQPTRRYGQGNQYLPRV